jgi:beta-lactamase regulating signal transducer with metallopeptidase domain
MTPTLLYLLKGNAVLLLFAVAYFGLLRRLTFFTLNRGYLLFALLFAAVYPALPVPALLPAETAPAVAVVVTEAVVDASVAPAAPVAPPVDWAMVGVALYAAGAAAVLARLLVQLLSLARLRRQSHPAVVQGLPVRRLAGAVSPFSFWQTIYLNPDQHPAPELAAVLRHEQVHVRQWHTLDVLLAQLALAAAWCNPAAWLLRRALLDNLEYLADHAVLETGLDRRAYQYSLLRLSHTASGPSLVSSFTFPTLKNRVVMMNLPLSSSGKLARYIVAGPLVLAVALGASGARAQGAGPAAPVARPVPTQGAPAVLRPAKAAATPAQKPAEVATTHKLMTISSKSVNPADHQLPDGIKAYIGATYPSSKLVGWTIMDETTRKASQAKYFASIVERSGEKRKLLFDAKQQPMAEPAHKEPASSPALAQAKYYVDGQEYPGDINTLDPKSIASINVFKGEKATQLFGEQGSRGVLVITTTLNQSRADVRAFNERLGIPSKAEPAPAAAPATPVVSVAYLAAPALEYITKHYPAARLLGVTELKDANGGPSRYQAEIVIGRRPGYVLFDGAGQFISESYTR